MAKKLKPPFSNGMTEEEVIAYLKAQKPQANENGERIVKKWKWAETDMLLRHQLIIYWLTKKGMTRLECVQMLMQEFDIDRSNAYEWSRQALMTLNEGFDEYRDMARQTQIEKIEKSIQECKDAGKYKEAAMFSEQLNKIYGLYTNNEKVEVKAEGPIRFEFDRN